MLNKNALDKVVNKYSECIVGHGYIDIIVLKENLSDFLHELSEMNVNINGVTWWCLCTEDSKRDCPHGMGGPKYKDGFFSEIVEEFDQLPGIKDNSKYLNLILNKETLSGLTYTKDECLTPALWLEVPSEWISISSK